MGFLSCMFDPPAPTYTCAVFASPVRQLDSSHGYWSLPARFTTTAAANPTTVIAATYACTSGG